MVRRNPRRGGPKTKKRKVTVVPAWTILPTDVIVKIAFFIPDESDLFTFLEALRVFNVLGPLEHLHKLGLKRKHEELWPTLKINPAVLESQFSTLLEAIAKFYSHVVIKDMTDVKWLRKHLNPAVQVEWITDEFPVPQEILDKWTDFRITRLNGDFYSLDSTGLNAILPKLRHVTALKMWVEDTLDHICALVAKSTQITELSIGAYMDDDLNESNLLDISEWLMRQPVRKFTFVGTHEWHDIGDAVKQKFFESMINCPTLDELKFDAREIYDLDFSKFTFSMRSLVVSGLDSDFAKSFASRLEGSKITDLWVRGYNIREKDAFRSLLQVLPKTSIKYLRLDDVRVDRKSWCDLASLLEKCPVETLALKFGKLHAEVAQSIAKALQKNKTICELDLTGSGMNIEDFQPLIESVTHPSRPVQTKRIKWIRQYRRAVHAEPLAKLKQLAEKRGGEFLF